MWCPPPGGQRFAPMSQGTASRSPVPPAWSSSMRHSPRLRRGLTAALVSLVTAVSAGSLVARAADNNANNADLVITKTASPNPVAVGGQITYTLTVTNNGPRPGTQI